MKCPVCNETLTMSERQGVELDKILEREASLQAPPARTFRAREDDEDEYRRDVHDRRYGGRRKSIWQEIFD